MQQLKSISKVFILITYFLFQFTNSYSQNQFKKSPKLVVGIVIEEMRYEMLLRYWDSFGENGFKKIIMQGEVCTPTHNNYLITHNSGG